MAFEFKLPDIGEGVVEGEIVKWLVSPGDVVREDDPLVEVMTDKATVELTSPRNGSIEKLFVAEGDTVPVGAVLVAIKEGGAGEAPAKPEPEKAAAPPEPPATPAVAPSPAASGSPRERTAEPAPAAAGRPAAVGGAVAPAPSAGAEIPAMPAVRRLARDLGVDLSRVRGSGPRGRIIEEDVKNAAASGVRSVGRAAGAAPADEVQPFRGLRRKIAEKMSESKHKAAHFTYVDEVDCTRLVELRAHAKARAAEKGVKLTYLAFIAKAVARAIEDHPILNATLDEEAGEIHVRGAVHLGIAADTDKGLIVPVVKDVQARSIFEIAGEIQRLAADAREGRSKLEDLTGSTFTITSVGSLGGMFATPIINYPEVAILGVNRIEERPVVRNGEIVVRHMSYFSLSLDHRVVDGADGARWMNTFKGFIEEPATLFLDALE